MSRVATAKTGGRTRGRLSRVLAACARDGWPGPAPEPGGAADRGNVEIAYGIGACGLGRLLVASSGRGVCAIRLGDADDGLVAALAGEFPRARLGGTARRVGVRLDLPGTPIQRRVWDPMREIPDGETAS